MTDLFKFKISNQPNFYTRIPDILDRLTYVEQYTDKKTGEVKYRRCRLDVYAKELYRVIMRICVTGEDYSDCWMNRDNLADEVNCSTGKITDAKLQLQQQFEQLDGKSLIEIEKKKNDKGEYDQVSLEEDFWRHNNLYCKIKNKYMSKQAKKEGTYCDIHQILPVGEIEQKEFYATMLRFKENNQTYEQIVHNHVHKMKGPSPHDMVEDGPSPHDMPSKGTMSPHDTNHIPLNHIPHERIKSLFYDQDGGENFNWKSINDLMELLGIYPSLITRIQLDKYLTEEVIASVTKRFLKYYQKNDQTQNPGAYYLKMIEKEREYLKRKKL